MSVFDYVCEILKEKTRKERSVFYRRIPILTTTISIKRRVRIGNIRRRRTAPETRRLHPSNIIRSSFKFIPMTFVSRAFNATASCRVVRREFYDYNFEPKQSSPNSRNDF